jgi:ubiquitin-like modifier-activating enzyme ATG7
MTIPMPGHPLSSESEQKAAEVDVTKLDGLVQGHDVVFLLTDTRESRWLPTVLAAAHDKLLLNTALGFDTFMVMRHGAQPLPSDTHPPTPPHTHTQAPPPPPKIEERIGCYFCNDVVAPEDSTKDRTLDQQCTVTRPGLAPMASALAVELMVALLHHPQRHRAPADCPEEDRKGGSNNGGGGHGGGGPPGLGQRFDDDVDRPLGILPQQIRGFLAHFTTILPVTRAFKHCTGCAPAVVEGYKERGYDLVRQACNDHVFLEELTGLAQMRREADEMEMLWVDEEEEEEEGGAEGREGEELDLDLGKATLSNAAPAAPVAAPTDVGDENNAAAAGSVAAPAEAGDGVDGGGGVEEAKETKPEEAKAEEM